MAQVIYMQFLKGSREEQFGYKDRKRAGGSFVKEEGLEWQQNGGGRRGGQAKGGVRRLWHV